MVTINLPVFAGMVPALDKRLIDDKFGQYVENAWLYSGVLDALPDKKNIFTLTNPFARTAFRIPANTDDPSYIYAGTWVEFSDADTDFVKAPVANDSYKRFYWTSKSQVPMYNTQTRLEAGQPGFYLGIPQPGNLGVVATGGASSTLVTRTYVATLVSEYGEEGPISNPTVITGAKIDALFTVTLPAVAAADMGTDRNIKKIRLYRTIVSSAGTVTYYLAAEVPARTTTQDILDPFTNLIIRSEEMDNASWIKTQSTVTANAITAPDGSITADKLVENASTNVHFITSPGGNTTGMTVVTGSIYVKAAERSSLQLRLDGGGGRVLDASYNLATGVAAAPVAGASFSNPISTLTALKNGWYRIDLMTVISSIANVTLVITLGATGADNYLGDGVSGLYIWGAQLTNTYTPHEYVKTTTATVTFTMSDSVLASRTILDSTVWTAPPGLYGMTAMPNGIMAGFRDNELWFSEPYRPHAWPAAYSLSLEFDIVGLGVVGNTLVVCTKGNPFTASGVHPSVISTTKIAAVEPCTTKGSIVSTENGVYYTSPNGLILVNAGYANNLTQQFITKDKWYEYITEAKVNAGKFGTAYFAYSASVSSSFDPAFQEDMVQQDDGEGDTTGFYVDPANQNVSFIRLIDTELVRSIKNDPWSSEMYFIRNGIVQWMDFRPGYDKAPYQWKSKLFQTPLIKNFTAYKLWFDPYGPVPVGTQNLDKNQTFNPATQYGVVRIYANGEIILCHEFRTPGELMRMPSGFKTDYWEIEIEARVRVSRFQMSTSVKELQVA